MGRSTTPSLFPDSLATPTARDEMNFAEFPVALLTDRVPDGVTELVFQDIISDKDTGRPVARKLRVSGPEPYGLPTVKDEEVLLGLLALTKAQNNFTEPTIQTTRYELVNLLGWSVDGRSYKRIEECLHRWAAAYLHYENAWWDNEDKAWMDVGFHVLDTVAIGKGQGRRGGKVLLEWNKVAFKSFRANYIKQIDLGFYQSLDSAIAKRLYRFLDKHFYRSERLEFDLGELAFEKVGLSRDYEPWKVKQKLEPALRELEERGFLEPLPGTDRYAKAGRGRWRVLFVRKAVQVPKAVEAKPAPPPEPLLVAELVGRGVHRDSARKLVAERPADAIAVRIEAFDWLMGRKDKPEKPSGYLYASIEKEYPLPDGFTPSTVKAAQAEAKRKELAEQTREARKRTEAAQSERALIAERRARVDAFLESLSAAERAAFEERALTLGPAEDLDHYRKASERGLATFAEQCRYKLLAHAMDAERPAA
ncbi:MAG: replication initiator protein A [Gemmataceae bacterium]|nr:replication initiator protein A [Gemmataceae bacterium]